MSAYDAIKEAIIAVLMGRDLSHDAQLGPLMAALAAAKSAPAPAAKLKGTAAPQRPSKFLTVPEEVLPYIRYLTRFNRLDMEEKVPIIAAIEYVQRNGGDVPFPNIGNPAIVGVRFPRTEQDKSRVMELMKGHTSLVIYDKATRIRLPSSRVDEDAASETASVGGEDEE